MQAQTIDIFLLLNLCLNFLLVRRILPSTYYNGTPSYMNMCKVKSSYFNPLTNTRIVKPHLTLSILKYVHVMGKATEM